VAPCKLTRLVNVPHHLGFHVQKSRRIFFKSIIMTSSWPNGPLLPGHRLVEGRHGYCACTVPGGQGPLTRVLCTHSTPAMAPSPPRHAACQGSFPGSGLVWPTYNSCARHLKLPLIRVVSTLYMLAVCNSDQSSLGGGGGGLKLRIPN
jgi:hypothetical protein